jgi:hypothetical protein
MKELLRVEQFSRVEGMLLIKATGYADDGNAA